MTVVVADTSPINYLVLIDSIDLLHMFYSTVLIPQAVHRELLRPGTPPKVRAWANDLLSWVNVYISTPVYPPVVDLDPGETEAISLALTTEATWLVMDEEAGRREAFRRGLQIIGTLGILRNAHGEGLLDFRTTVVRLQALGFRISPSLLQSILDSLA